VIGIAGPLSGTGVLGHVGHSMYETTIPAPSTSTARQANGSISLLRAVRRILR
jgi:hypothetical protein